MESINSKERISLEDVVEREYKEYQIYTLMDRALPHIIDGLKPSQRRILYILYKNAGKGLQKVSSAAGLVLHLHPHGNVSVEGSIVKLAQDFTFSNNYPLLDKKGYFGERMEPKPAASRYIECKISNLAKILLFDDMNQVPMVNSYDDKTKEPAYLLPKLPMMLLNGVEGIATGYSVMIPSFNHNDIIKSMKDYLTNGKASRINPWFDNYDNKVIIDKKKNSYIFEMKIEKLKENGKESFFITELPRGYDSKKINKHLNNLIENDIIKDYTDSSVENNIMIELIFKKGSRNTLESVYEKVGVSTSLSPNYTLIDEDGVLLYNQPEEIIELFCEQRRKVIKKRYELLIENTLNTINKNNEIIRFIKQKHYAQAENKKDRSAYLKYLKTKKFHYAEYLADMSIYRMTKDEVSKRQLLINEDNKLLKEYKKIYKSSKLLDQKLVEELDEIKELLTKSLRDKNTKKK